MPPGLENQTCGSKNVKMWFWHDFTFVHHRPQGTSQQAITSLWTLEMLKACKHLQRECCHEQCRLTSQSESALFVCLVYFSHTFYVGFSCNAMTLFAYKELNISISMRVCKCIYTYIYMRERERDRYMYAKCTHLWKKTNSIKVFYSKKMVKGWLTSQSRK